MLGSSDLGHGDPLGQSLADGAIARYLDIADDATSQE